MDKYDPYYFPEYPHRKYDTITCIYVLNVIQNEKERDDVVENIQDLLKLKGTAYIAVRRDIPKNGTESQVWVELDLPIIRNHPNYTIYELTKWKLQSIIVRQLDLKQMVSYMRI